MKVALLLRGPIRPDSESVIRNTKNILNTLTSLGLDIDIDTFLITSTEFDSKCSIDPKLNLIFNSLVFLPRISREKLYKSTFGYEIWPTGQNLWNSVNSHYAARAGISLVLNTDDYDFIVYTRTDLTSIKLIKEDLDKWFNPRSYNVLYSRYSNEDINAYDFERDFNSPFKHRTRMMKDGIHHELYTFDNFAIATPDIMYKAWNFHSDEILSKFIFNCIIPENVLDQILHYNRVRVNHITTDLYEGCKYFALDSNRGQGLA